MNRKTLDEFAALVKKTANLTESMPQEIQRGRDLEPFQLNARAVYDGIVDTVLVINGALLSSRDNPNDELKMGVLFVTPTPETIDAEIARSLGKNAKRVHIYIHCHFPGEKEPTLITSIDIATGITTFQERETGEPNGTGYDGITGFDSTAIENKLMDGLEREYRRINGQYLHRVLHPHAYSPSKK